MTVGYSTRRSTRCLKATPALRAGVTPQVHTGRLSSFRFPDGVEFLGDGGGNAQLRVSIPLDVDGFFGRECLECDQHFRIAHEDYDALPDDLSLWCVYCGHHDDQSEFLTQQQRARVMRAATDYGMQLILSAACQRTVRSADNDLPVIASAWGHLVGGRAASVSVAM